MVLLQVMLVAVHTLAATLFQFLVVFERVTTSVELILYAVVIVSQFLNECVKLSRL